MLPLPVLTLPTFEHHPDGFGLGHRRPRISWRFYRRSDDKLPSAENWVQRAYDMEIQISGSTESKFYHIESNESRLVPWPSEDLESCESLRVRVRSYGQGIDEVTEWSSWANAEVALLEKERWSAVPIVSSRKFEEENTTLHPMRFRKSFSLPDDRHVNKARIYITALGLYEAYINGVRVGDHVLAPGWTSYSHRTIYQTFDVTEMLVVGENIIAAEVGEGWYAGMMGIRGGQRFNYGKEIGLLAQLEMILDDGATIVQSTDNTWKCHPSAILSSEIYNGEVYDLNEEQNGWQMSKFDDKHWMSVKGLPLSSASLIAHDIPPVRVIESVNPVSVTSSPSGKTIFDFGQNLVGFISIRSLPPNCRITMLHAEVLVDGELGMRPLRGAKCSDTVISANKEVLDWHPKFTYHGFRYMELDGWPEALPLSANNFVALVIHTDMKRRGWFKCSNSQVNKLHSNVIWSMRGNFVSVPTDCPQRDERLGWTGDIQAFAPTANFLYDTHGIVSYDICVICH